jgi:hypothetical protein
VLARVALVTAAAPHVKDDMVAMSDREIKLAAIKSIAGEKAHATALAASDDYVAARFDSALEKTEAEPYKGMQRVDVAAAGKSPETDEAAAMARMNADRANAWKTTDTKGT